MSWLLETMYITSSNTMAGAVGWKAGCNRDCSKAGYGIKTLGLVLQDGSVVVLKGVAAPSYSLLPCAWVSRDINQGKALS